MYNGSLQTKVLYVREHDFVRVSVQDAVIYSQKRNKVSANHFKLGKIEKSGN